MRLVTFEPQPRVARIGALTAKGSIVDLNYACALQLRAQDERAFYRMADARIPPDMRLFFEGGDRAIEAAAAAFDYAFDQGEGAEGPRGESIFHRLDKVKLKAPIRPWKFLHAAGNFQEDNQEEGHEPLSSHSVPPLTAFFQNVDAIVGHGEAVVYPHHLTGELDCEVGLAVVLKRSGKHFNAKRAVDYIGGYTIFNDITARDIQREEARSGVYTLSKGIDTFCPLGPWIVTADEIDEPHNLAIELRVNGTVRQRSHSNRISVTIPEILSRYSAMGYSAGDVVSTNTISGGGAVSGSGKPTFLQPGDLMECEVERIGVLQNRIISWDDALAARF